MPIPSQTPQTRSTSPRIARVRSSYAPTDHETTRSAITGETALCMLMPAPACATLTATTAISGTSGRVRRSRSDAPATTISGTVSHSGLRFSANTSPTIAAVSARASATSVRFMR